MTRRNSEIARRIAARQWGGRVPGHRFEHQPFRVIAELAVAVAS